VEWKQRSRLVVGRALAKLHHGMLANVFLAWLEEVQAAKMEATLATKQGTEVRPQQLRRDCLVITRVARQSGSLLKHCRHQPEQPAAILHCSCFAICSYQALQRLQLAKLVNFCPQVCLLLSPAGLTGQAPG
jgi:hypothetical protein